MTSLAHVGISRSSRIALILVVVTGTTGGCTSSTDAPTAPHDAGAERTQLDADGGACEVHTDCALVFRGCCGSCAPPPKTAMRAVPRSRLAEAQRDACPTDVACAPCWEPTYEPLAPKLAAACVAGQCAVLDLREEPLTRCSGDAECTVRSASCCPACGEDPTGYLAVRTDADAAVLDCNPLPPCAPCTMSGAAPEAFCARDGHCAVKGLERLDGGTSGVCFSPNQNLASAYATDAVGCDCTTPGASACVTGPDGRAVGLDCGPERRWRAVEDGPCGPTPR
ncbi:MAG: hypothetical protein ABW252_05535 [Polyangiales bacterium]